jgi:hypothetical protein
MNRGVNGKGKRGEFAFCGVASVTAGKRGHLPPPHTHTHTHPWVRTVQMYGPQEWAGMNPLLMLTVAAILYAGLQSREYGRGDPLR